MPIIMVINLKGGVAKTTTSVALAECFAAHGRQTLLIDADHQSMAGELLLGERRQIRCERQQRTLHDLLGALLEDRFSAGDFHDFIVPGGSNIDGGLATLSTLPSSLRIDDFAENMAKARRGYRSSEEFLAAFNRRRGLMRDWLHRNFQYTFIDCPPSLALQVKFFLSVADAYILPSIPDRLATRGSLHFVHRTRSKQFRIHGLGTLWTLYRPQNPVHRRIIQATQRQMEPLDHLPRPFQTVIPDAARIANAADVANQRPASFREKYGPANARLFELLCQEIETRAALEQRITRPVLAGVAA